MEHANCNQSDSNLLLYINGKKVVVENPDPEDTLLLFLREKMRLTGTKLGCAEGGCGACTVMVSKYDRRSNTITHMSANACLAPLVSLHGQAITTVEGIGSTKTRLHAVQERLALSHGSQCGFCTPGIIMSMYALLRNKPIPSQHDLESAFDGNLCRCTGYRPILQAFKTFTAEGCPMGEKCCKNQNNNSCGPPEDLIKDCNDSTQDLIFPPELKLVDFSEYKLFKGERVVWHQPVVLNHLLELKKQHPNARLVCGNTEIGVEVKLKNQLYPVLISTSHVPELCEIQITDDGVWFGGSVTLAQLGETLTKQVEILPAYKTRIYSEVINMLKWFAGHQIRNVSSIAGNFMTASPISDLNPLHLAARSTIRVQSSDRGVREIKLDEQFFISYRKTAVADDEVFISVHIPATSESEYFSGYKQAHRKEDDIAIVNAGMRVKFDGYAKVEDICLAFGGMAPITKFCVETNKGLKGLPWDDRLLEEGIRFLKEDLPLPDTSPGGMVDYRKTLAISFFYKFYLTVKKQLNDLQIIGETISESEASAIQELTRNEIKGIQVFQDNTTEVGDCFKPLPHRAATLQCTGEAQYIDDLPRFKDELYLALVTSSVAHGRIVSIDPSDALAAQGVADFISAKDIPGSNIYRFTNDELVFANEKVTCVGHIIGAVVADTQRHAQSAAKMVKIKYEELPAIFTIEQAIEARSYLKAEPSRMWKGDVEAGFSESDIIIEGEMRVGGQEHFYLETQAALCIPRENDEIELFSSTQNPTELQMFTSSVLNVPSNRINIRVKRMGGGFGGKETRASVIALPVAVAAHKLRRPVRCMFDRDEDMLITGTRHPFLGKFKVGVSRDGKINALEAMLYSNTGNSTDLAYAIMDRALFHIDNAYNISNMKVQGLICKTNIASNTAFRGFGGPQGMMIMEHIISQISSTLEIPDHKIREMNMYKEGDVTHFGQRLDNFYLTKCWSQVLADSDYLQRQSAIDNYNRQNRWRKRGICAIPTKFGISFTHTPLNQSGALVHIYMDGNVLLNHGGTEMGQGLYTKMIQVASTALGIPSDRIYTIETSTTTVPNTSPTAASAGSDLNGAAIMEACNELNRRLQPFKDANPSGSWNDWVKTAYLSRVSLSASGFYSTPGLFMDFSTSKGNPFGYFTYGAAVSEVEIDCLTGDHQVLRTDIVMDVGKSLNPAIDVGQIEGGFVQGYGLFCLEQIKLLSGKGHLLTRGPGAYKIPGFGSIPQEFNVTLLKDAPNVKAVYSSKAIGEPPLFLAASVFYAIKSAIKAFRVEGGASKDFTIFSPCTPERIRMSCIDKFTRQFTEDERPGISPKSFFVEP